MRPSRIPRAGVASLAAAAMALVGLSPSAGADPIESTETNTNADARIDVDLSDSKSISERLYGLFYEDINHAADGGLYAELVQNRSFEFSPADNASYHPLTAWSVDGDASVQDQGGLNGANPSFLRLGAGGSASNAGYNTGIAVEAGRTYDFSVWARADRSASLTVAVTDAGGNPVAAPAEVRAVNGDWQKYEVAVAAEETTADGRLTVTANGAADLDVVSLFPRDTFMGRENGLRSDLAGMIADLEPSFLRFPGGCIVNTGSYDRDSRERAYNWKDTVGPVEERLVNHNFWGYNQSYGLGYYEYFQFAEDLGAEAIPVVPVGVTGCGDSPEITDPDQLQTWVDDTLDLIEFANGPADSEWGSVRAEMGHPEPFGMEYIGLGNEEYKEQFYANYPAFHDAVREAHPEIRIIANSGTDDEGAVFDRSWEFAREQGADLVDEHYYNSPEWFLSNNDRYDDYDREGPHVFIGEYASQSNTWRSGLAEASYLTGVERNGDVIDLASYAPLLSNIDYIDWTPDMIWFDNDEAVGSVNYEVQKLFAANAGDEAAASTLTADGGTAAPDIRGGVGLGTWNTAATYDNVKVTGADGATLLEDDFTEGADQWTPTGPDGEPVGDWSVVDGAYTQSAIVENARSTAGSADWSNYTIELDATKQSGDEGFLVMFGVEGSDDFYWWNLGGWGNTTSAVEVGSGGSKSTLVEHDTTVEDGRTYHLELRVEGRTITGLVDGEEAFSFEHELTVEPLYQVVTRDSATGDAVLKVVNARDTAMTTDVELTGADLASTGSVTTLECAESCDNVLGEEPVLQPVEETSSDLGNSFSYEFAPHSVTFIRLHEEGAGGAAVECSVDYEVVSRDGRDFTAHVTMENESSAPMRDWELTWDAKGVTGVRESWGADVSRDGKTLKAVSEGRHASLGGGESLRVAVSGTGNPEKARDFRVNGSRCA
ncbi:alpha-L-arabinofuranosidase C-terminal domain-containing protein [Salininema proteolyticum]|uniref:non-reducing end alpha-L-arabinofuranosidase n=1 Tax=Salininema proteolyticum TaxID=1607685 RepID=A0ABV8TXF9_9ACTN